MEFFFFMPMPELGFHPNLRSQKNETSFRRKPSAVRQGICVAPYTSAATHTAVIPAFAHCCPEKFFAVL
ncbi:hypothetical protein, partial [Dyella sp.]|uniref:hypothetical protein n=1 Tax=Dyella sp. TaxID=1869338 RepID=UPI002FDA459E